MSDQEFAELEAKVKKGEKLSVLEDFLYRQEKRYREAQARNPLLRHVEPYRTPAHRGTVDMA